MKKRIFIVLLCAVTAVCMIFTGCDSADINEYQSEVKDQVYDSYETFKNDLGKCRTEDQMVSYFENWASKRKIYSETVKDAGIVIQKASSSDTSGAASSDSRKNRKKSIILECSVSKDDISATAKEAAMALTSMEKSTAHGPISVLLVKSGCAKNVPDKYLKADDLISLTERTSPRLFTGSAAQASTVVHKTLHETVPDSGTAFRITIKGCEGGDSAQRDRSHPNPIREIGSVLNDCRSDGIVMQIASFNGGKSDYSFVKSASATVCVASSEADKFESKFESAISKYKDKYIKHESDLSFTIEQVPMPSRAFTSSDTYSILSLLYTLDDGIYDPADESEDDEDSSKDDTLTAFANIGTISTENDELDIGIYLRSTDEKLYREMLKTYKDTAGLSDAGFKVVSSNPLWKSGNDGDLVKALVNIAEKNDITLEPGSTFMTTNAAVYADKNNKLDVAVLGVDMQDATELTTTLLMFIEGNYNV